MFRIRDEQMAALRKQSLIETLKREFAVTHAVAVDPTTGDVLLTDARGNRCRGTFGPDGHVAALTYPEGRVVQYTVAPEGVLLAKTLPSGLRIGREYDDEGRLQAVSHNGSPIVELAYQGESDLVTAHRFPDHTEATAEYDGALQLTAFTDRLGNRLGLEYDEDGELVALLDRNGGRTTFASGTTPAGAFHETVFPDGSVLGWEMDAEGDLSSYTTSGTTAVVVRNEVGLPEAVRYADGEELEYEYDAGIFLTKSVSPGGTSEFVWGGKGRLQEERQDGRAVHYDYDETGAAVGLTYPDGSKVQYAFDREGRIVEIVDWHGGRHQWSYTPDDRKAERLLPNKLRETLEYTETGWLAFAAVFPPSTSGSASFATRYAYDAEGRLATVTDTLLGARDSAYDANGQVRSVKGSRRGQSEGFLYDPAGNWKTSNGAPVQCNLANQMKSLGATKFTHDERGNTTSATGPRGTWQYVWNLHNQLVRAEGGGAAVEFGYDGLGRRLWKRSADKLVRYTWAGDWLVHEVEQRGTLTTTRDYLYYPNSFAPLAVRVNGHVYCYHTDHLGTPRRLTDQHGQVVWLADFTTFGEARIEAALVQNDLRFQGQQYDEETGLHYNRFRYYSPNFGRYLSRDPLGFIDGPNLYAYTHNNPLNAIDPLGLTGQYLPPSQGILDPAGTPKNVKLQGGVTKWTKKKSKDPAVHPPRRRGPARNHGKKRGGGKKTKSQQPTPTKPTQPAPPPKPKRKFDPRPWKLSPMDAFLAGIPMMDEKTYQFICAVDANVTGTATSLLVGATGGGPNAANAAGGAVSNAVWAYTDNASPYHAANAGGVDQGKAIAGALKGAAAGGLAGGLSGPLGNKLTGKLGTNVANGIASGATSAAGTFADDISNGPITLENAGKAAADAAKSGFNSTISGFAGSKLGPAVNYSANAAAGRGALRTK